MSDDPKEHKRSPERELVTIAVPVLVYVALVRTFIGDNPDHPLMGIVVGIPYFLSLAALAPLVIYSLVANSAFASVSVWRRVLLIACSCIAPLTAEFVLAFPKASRAITERSPALAGIWTLLALSAAAVVGLALVSGRAEASHPPASAKTSHTSNLAVSGPNRTFSLSEIVGILAGVATIVGVLWQIGRDLGSGR